MKYTVEHIRSLAPDIATLERAEGIAYSFRWQLLAGNGRFVWAILRMNVPGVAPFQVAIDLYSSVFKCTCPVRRMPCKHALAILLMYVKQPEVFNYGDHPPDGVQKWINSRIDNENAPIENNSKTFENQPIDSTSRREMLLEKIEGMEAGFNDLQQWLSDVMRIGLASLPIQTIEDIATRMTDAGLQGIARRLRLMASLPQEEENYFENHARAIAEIYLLKSSALKAKDLTPELLEDLANNIGIYIKKNDVLAQQPINDNWVIMGQIEGKEDIPPAFLKYRRIWLYGLNSRKFAMLLDYMPGNMDFEHSFISGKTLQGNLYFYPSNYPLRALLPNFVIIENNKIDINNLFYHSTIEKFQESLTTALSANPWLANFPVIFKNIIPVIQKNKYYVADEEGILLNINMHKNKNFWALVAASGANPSKVFGEWDINGYFSPLCIIKDDGMLNLE